MFCFLYAWSCQADTVFIAGPSFDKLRNPELVQQDSPVCQTDRQTDTRTDKTWRSCVFAPTPPLYSRLSPTEGLNNRGLDKIRFEFRENETMILR